MGKLIDDSLELEETKLKTFVVQLKRSFVIAKKDLKIYYNKPPVIIQGILFPIILFVALTIGRNVAPIYVISGLMAMIIFLSSTSIGPIVFPWETMRRTFERLITCPISIKTILLGSVWSTFIYGIIFSSLPLIFGMIFLSMELSINLFIVLVGMVVAGLAFACFSLILSVPSTDTPGNTMVFTILIKFPLIFISPLFMPITLSPISYISPMTYFVDIVNVGLGDISVFGPLGLLLDIGVLVGFGFGFLLLAFILHGKTLEKRFRD
ncbi:MAG: ABC transporter permease [Candidatus Lokiarchaeota archaeon]|nr:ABC transporter permease [Candidatus Lokiarchaeota archaeon]